MNVNIRVIVGIFALMGSASAYPSDLTPLSLIELVKVKANPDNTVTIVRFNVTMLEAEKESNDNIVRITVSPDGKATKTKEREIRPIRGTITTIVPPEAIKVLDHNKTTLKNSDIMSTFKKEKYVILVNSPEAIDKEFISLFSEDLYFMYFDNYNTKQIK